MISKRPIVIIILMVVIVLAVAVIFGIPAIKKYFFKPTNSTVQSGLTGGTADAEDISIAAKELSVPWGLASLPNGDLLVTERPGTLRRIGQDQKTYPIQGVTETSEGGLLGLALDPDFAANGRIYVYLTSESSGPLTNRIESYRLANDVLSDRKVILDGIPASANHDGGRIAFGPDGYLYATTGDAGNERSAQDRTSLAGKILRITTDGAAAPGNPFGSAVYSYGHRNPQGLAWDDKGQLWSTEHGRSGPASGYDELNLIKPGANYGWPDIQGDETRTGMTPPVAHSGASDTWAPAGLAVKPGKNGEPDLLFFGGLRGQALYQATIQDDNSVKLKAHFRESYGRLRTTLVVGDSLYLTTSNRDGRGEPQAGDDRILKIKLSVF